MFITTTTIAIDAEVRAKIEKLKVHPRETVNDVLRRVLLVNDR